MNEEEILLQSKEPTRGVEKGSLKKDQLHRVFLMNFIQNAGEEWCHNEALNGAHLVFC